MAPEAESAFDASLLMYVLYSRTCDCSFYPRGTLLLWNDGKPQKLQDRRIMYRPIEYLKSTDSPAENHYELNTLNIPLQGPGLP